MDLTQWLILALIVVGVIRFLQTNHALMVMDDRLDKLKQLLSSLNKAAIDQSARDTDRIIGTMFDALSDKSTRGRVISTRMRTTRHRSA
jgi:hypothetical protein